MKRNRKIVIDLCIEIAWLKHIREVTMNNMMLRVLSWCVLLLKHSFFSKLLYNVSILKFMATLSNVFLPFSIRSTQRSKWDCAVRILWFDYTQLLGIWYQITCFTHKNKIEIGIAFTAIRTERCQRAYNNIYSIYCESSFSIQMFRHFNQMHISNVIR